MAELNDRQKRFCEEYLVDLNATQAAIRAGYSKRTAGIQSHDLLKKPNIQAFIQLRRSKISNKLEISQERVLLEYARIAFSNIRALFDETGALKGITDLTEEQSAILSSVEIDELFAPAGKDKKKAIGKTSKLKLWDKTRALDALGKHLGLFEKDNEQKKPEVFDLTKLSPQELNTLLALRKKAS